jgi:flagellar biosynthesis chaperone FliJ
MKLDVLRRYRAQLEEVVRMDLFLLRQELQDAEARSRLLDAQMRLTIDAYLVKAGRGVALDEFLVWQSMFAAETSNSAAAQQVEGQLREAWNQKQNELREAMHDRRKLDRLAERMRQQRHLVQHRVDQMEMDEAARRTSVL